MPTGFAEHIALIQRLPDASVVASKAAVTAAIEPIYDRSQEYVPVDRGTLKASGQKTDPAVADGVVSAAVVYGSTETVTEWHGVGYEIFVELGTSRQGAQPFLEQAVMESIAEIPSRMGAAYSAALAEALR